MSDKQPQEAPRIGSILGSIIQKIKDMTSLLLIVGIIIYYFLHSGQAESLRSDANDITSVPNVYKLGMDTRVTSVDETRARVIFTDVGFRDEVRKIFLARPDSYAVALQQIIPSRNDSLIIVPINRVNLTSGSFTKVIKKHFDNLLYMYDLCIVSFAKESSMNYAYIENPNDPSPSLYKNLVSGQIEIAIEYKTFSFHDGKWRLWRDYVYDKPAVAIQQIVYSRGCNPQNGKCCWM